MSNNYFKFKQFTINQDKTAMKVGTDGVLLGVLTTPSNTPKHILDIGTGTGLVALMLAQRFQTSLIDAVEIDKEAFEQASENFTKSPFADRLHSYLSDIKYFTSSYSYDLIVSNPPYFINSLKAPDIQRTLARHTDSLPFSILANSVSRLLSSNGLCFVIIPFDIVRTLTNIFCSNKLYPHSILTISHNEKKQPKRAVISFGFDKTEHVAESQLFIEKSPGNYSNEFQTLVEPFYL